MAETGPIYGVKLIDTLTLPSGLKQAMPSRLDLEQVAKISQRVSAGYEVAITHLACLEGAMAAQDEREREAGERCGVSWEEHGCDWPDRVADVVQSLRTANAALEAEVGRLERERDEFREERDKPLREQVREVFADFRAIADDMRAALTAQPGGQEAGE